MPNPESRVPAETKTASSETNLCIQKQFAARSFRMMQFLHDCRSGKVYSEDS